ncbi:MAG TPA: terminase large subunit, partial [Alphaproteobacteria bacterium]|nr:terminase large subunit [Alphaproteobacteria bacterium]
MAAPHVVMANRYARDVVSGKVPACRFVRAACQRHLDDLNRERIRIFPYRFDKSRAEKVCKHIERQVHVKGKWSGKLLRLEPWQAFLFCVLFGWAEKSTGLRRFRKAYIEVPRKNGKSVIAAGIGNYMLTADEEKGAEVYCGATSESQAWEVFRPAKQMMEQSPGMRSFYAVEINAKSMVATQTSSRFHPVIGKPGDGASPSCAIVD